MGRRRPLQTALDGRPGAVMDCGGEGGREGEEWTVNWHSGRPYMDGPERGIGMKMRWRRVQERNRRTPDGPKWTSRSTR